MNVYLQTSLFESQLTLFNSTITSLKNMFIFCEIVINLLVFKTARGGYLFIYLIIADNNKMSILKAETRSHHYFG